MSKRMIRKDIVKCFAKSKGRFISIMCLVALGSFALVGLQVAGPDMRNTGIHYFEKLKTADISIIGDYGIDETNQAAINQVSGADKIVYGYLKDVTIQDTQTSIRIFSETEGISEYEVVDGRMPETNDEIALASFYSDEYALGDSISFHEKEDDAGDTVLVNTTYKIVGFVNSGELLSMINLGESTAGTGELEGYAVVIPEAFDSDIYMIARLSFEDTKGVDPYSSEYTQILQAHKDELAELMENQPDLRLQAIKQEYQDKIDEAQQEVDDGKKELADALQELTDGEAELADAKQEYADGQDEYETAKADAESQLASARSKLSSAKTQINEGKTELTAKQQEYSEAESQLASARATLDAGWEEYNAGVAQLEQLSAAKAQLDAAQSELDSKIASTGMSISEIEAALPGIQSQIDSAQSQYNSLSQLKTLKSQRDAAQGTENYDALNEQYQAALQSAGMSETQADAMYGQMDSMKAQIDTAQTQYDQLSALVSAYDTLQDNWAAYNAAASQAEGAQAKLDAAKTQLDAGETEYAAKAAELAAAKTQLDEAQATLDAAQAEYDAGMKSYKSAKSKADSELAEAKAKLDDAAQEIADAEQELADGWEEYNEKKPDADQEIADAEEKLNDARNELARLEAPVYVLDSRREIPGAEGYKTYATVSEIIDSLADIFPLFLYFVAALVTLTTMTRFVDEERINAGTLKALGYSDRDIVKKFVIYGFIASMVGAIIGIAAGHTLLPMIVYNAYGDSFTYPEIELQFYPVISVIALALAFLCAVVPAMLVAKRELQQKPATLLMPKAPQAGSKILMEHIPFIWNHLSFTHKVTARNIFRYKKRMLMTIFGVCGSVTLIFAGFSVQNSISGVKERQFEQIMKYDLIVAENSNLITRQRNEIDALLASDDVDSCISIYYEEASKVAGDNLDRQTIKVIVPQSTEALRPYINLVNRKSGEELKLIDDGCLITERLGDLLNVGVGDTITFNDADDVERTVTVSGIAEMYTGHFIFMNDAYYEKVYDTAYEQNADLVILTDNSSESAQNAAAKFIDLEGVKGVVQNTTMTNQIDTIVSSLNRIMDILILVAVMLALVILYNLTNINVSERIRELSTIKVLGFYDPEVTMYIYRETILLTLLGILVGFGFGDALYMYIITVVPPDEVMFNPALGAKAFIIPTVVVSVITVLLGLMMNHRLKHVDMLEALKSVE